MLLNKMIPPNPASLQMTTMPATKAKIGFSIDSIVGDDITNGKSSMKDNKLNDFKYANDYQTEIARALRISDTMISGDGLKFRGIDELTDSDANRNKLTHLLEYSMQQHLQNSHQRECSISPPTAHPTFPTSARPQSGAMLPTSKSRTPSPHRTTQLEPISPAATYPPTGPSGPIRPLPIVPDSKQIPAYLNLPGLPGHHNPQILQAQFQMAAALARQAEQPPPGFPGAAAAAAAAAAAKFGHPHMMNPNIPRDSYPLYPWLLSRHGRIFPPGFPGNFLLHPFRKPKRVRTAFSPSQLLKLEHAFESNQYVVGAERKALAQALNLSETQVKVWFQNRRTKHKRMQQEEDTKGTGGNSNNNNSSGSNDTSRNSYDEDEMIDMEMDDDCMSDDEV